MNEATAQQLRVRERVLSVKRAFEGAGALRGHWFVRLVVRLGLARLAGFVLSDQTWLAIVLADLERFCHARLDQTTYVLDDPSGRDSAQLEGKRQVFQRLAASLALTPAEFDQMMKTTREEQEEMQSDAA